MNHRYPLSPRLAPLKVILAKLNPPQPPSGLAPQLQARDAHFRGRQTPATRVKPYRGPPMTLGNAAAAKVRLIVWSRD
jgi:hypothetical protein